MPRPLLPFAVQLAAALGEPIPIFIHAIHGRIGDRVYKTYRRPRGQVRLVVTRVPDFTGCVPTAAQRTQRDRMRAATAYAQRVYADPAAKALYLAAAQKVGRCAFRLAIGDYLAGRVRVPATALGSPPITPSTPADVGRGRRTPPGLALPRITPMIADPNLPSTPAMPAAGRDVSPRRPPCAHVRRPLLRGRLGEPPLPPPRRARPVFIRGYPRHLRSGSSPPANSANPRGFEPAQVRFRGIGLPAAPPGTCHLRVELSPGQNHPCKSSTPGRSPLLFNRLPPMIRAMQSPVQSSTQLR